MNRSVLVALIVAGDYRRSEDVIADVRAHSRSDLPVIPVTGDTSSAMRKLPHDRNLRVASKPINADELLAMLHELLEEPPTASQMMQI